MSNLIPGYAFSPKALTKEDIRIWFKETLVRKFSWKKFKFIDMIMLDEVWTDDNEDFYPGNCSFIPLENLYPERKING